MTDTSAPRVLVLGALDTKGHEFAFLKEELIRLGCRPFVVDVGTLGDPGFPPDVSREEVLARAGRTLDDFKGGARRGEAVQSAIAGAVSITGELHLRGDIDAVVSMGGGTGTAMAGAVMQSLPSLFPKVLLTTLKDLTRHISDSDATVLKCPVDLVGLNAITRTCIRRTAATVAAICGAELDAVDAGEHVVITCLGVTTPGVMKLRERLIAEGEDVVVLHRETRIVDDLLDRGMVGTIIDFTPNEITEGMIFPPGEDDLERLGRARASGVPYLLSAGGLDLLILFVPHDKRPVELMDRPYVQHSPVTTLVRTTVDEQRRLGAVLGRSLREVWGPAAAVIPMGGFSMWDREGMAFDQPAARAAFAESLRTAAAGVEVVEVPANINDDEFVDSVFEVFRRMKGEQGGRV